MPKTHPITVILKEETYQQIKKLREAYGFNTSKICQKALEHAIKKISDFWEQYEKGEVDGKTAKVSKDHGG